MKYVVNLFASIPKAPRSHVLGWSLYWAAQLRADILRELRQVHGSDTLYIDHGVNFGGSLNLFGGVSDELALDLSHLVKIKPQLVSLDIPMPAYAESLAKRLGAKSTSPLLTKQLVNGLAQWFGSAKTMAYPHETPTWITVGDSHATAFAPANSEVHRANGLTLHGLLESWDTRFPDLTLPRYKKLKKITIVAGSIDIRHHLCRQPDPTKAMLKLVTWLIRRAQDLADKGFTVELCAPVPVEYEGRPLPKTGYYQGSPFFGSQIDRAQLTDKMIQALKRGWSTVTTPPTVWYHMDREKYATTIMERGGSVHIAPPNYRSAIPRQWCTL